MQGTVRKRLQFKMICRVANECQIRIPRYTNTAVRTVPPPSNSDVNASWSGDAGAPRHGLIHTAQRRLRMLDQCLVSCWLLATAPFHRCHLHWFWPLCFGHAVPTLTFATGAPTHVPPSPDLSRRRSCRGTRVCRGVTISAEEVSGMRYFRVAQ